MITQGIRQRRIAIRIVAWIAVAAVLVPTGAASAKSLYLTSQDGIMSAWDIQGTDLVWQAQASVGAGVGLAIDSDATPPVLFQTSEGYGTIQLKDAELFTDLGFTTAPDASNLAGIVYDHEKGLLYAVDRGTTHLYVYTWDATTYTLTNTVTTAPYYIDLPGVSAYGIALDEVNDLLYVASYDHIDWFNTSDWSSAGSYTPNNICIGIAVDVTNGLLYFGGAWMQDGLSQYNLATQQETSVYLGSGVGVMGVAVDPATSLVYVSTGYQGNDLRVFDDTLTQLFVVASGAYSPAGICIPGREISYNPLGFSKDDGLDEGACVNAGDQITYTICYENDNEYDVTGAEIVDALPEGVTFVSATGGGVYNAEKHQVYWTIGDIAAGAAQQCVELVVQVGSVMEAGEEISNPATIDSNETPQTTQTEITPVCELDCNNNGIADRLDFRKLYSVRNCFECHAEGGGGGSDGLDTIDPYTGETLATVTIMLPNEEIVGANGLTAHPTTGALWAILRTYDYDNGERNGDDDRHLGTIDPTTGAVTSVGELSDKFASIAFNAAGTLYGITGDGAETPNDLFTLSLTDASAVFVIDLGDGAPSGEGNGEAIAYNFDDGLLYRMGATVEEPPPGRNGDIGFQSINLTTLEVTDIELSGPDVCDTVYALVYDAPLQRFLMSGCGGELFSVTPNGFSTHVGGLDEKSKGLAFLGSLDCNGNGVPDECEDCNENGIADECEFAAELTTTSIILSEGDAGWFGYVHPLSAQERIVGPIAPGGDMPIFKDVAVDPTTGLVYTVDYPIQLAGMRFNVQYIHQIDTSTGEGTPLPQPLDPQGYNMYTGGLTFSADGTMYGIGFDPYSSTAGDPEIAGIVVIDKTTGAISQELNPEVHGFGMATSPAGEIYSVTVAEPATTQPAGRDVPDALTALQRHDPATGDVLASVDLTDAASQDLMMVIDIAYGDDGLLYGVAWYYTDFVQREGGPGEELADYGNLVTIDPVTGELTQVESLHAVLMGLGGPTDAPTVVDCNDNGIPDECETDCNDNGVPDDCDIADSTSNDCNENGVPDECDAALLLAACPDTITLQAIDAAGIVVAYPTPATQFGGCEVVVTIDPPSGTLFPVGTTTVTVTASDELGSQLSCAFDVVVIPPVEPSPEPTPPGPEPDPEPQPAPPPPPFCVPFLFQTLCGMPLCAPCWLGGIATTFVGLAGMKWSLRRRRRVSRRVRRS